MKRAGILDMRVVIVLLLGLLTFGCNPTPTSSQEAQPMRQSRELPATRTFYMGFTPLPWDFTEEAFRDTYRRISENGDIVAHHLDEGVPWTEALEGRPYAENVRADIARRKANTKGREVFLSVTPLALDRQSLANYWGTDSHMPNPAPFAGATLNAPEVKTAFTNYALDMIETFDPAFFAYAIEISDIKANPAVRSQFVDLAAHVYAAVKDRHPSLPVFPTYTLGDAASVDVGLMRDLAPYTDVVAVSTYPFVWDGVGGDAGKIPRDWFEKIAAVLPGKPFAVAETGFLAGRFSKLTSLVFISSDPSSQEAYVDFLLSEAQRLNAAFVIWYVPMDYDRLWEKMKANGMNAWFAQWMRTGLWDAAGEGRPGLDLWNRWRQLPRR